MFGAKHSSARSSILGVAFRHDEPAPTFGGNNPYAFDSQRDFAYPVQPLTQCHHSSHEVVLIRGERSIDIKLIFVLEEIEGTYVDPNRKDDMLSSRYWLEL